MGGWLFIFFVLIWLKFDVSTAEGVYNYCYYYGQLLFFFLTNKEILFTAHSRPVYCSCLRCSFVCHGNDGNSCWLFTISNGFQAVFPPQIPRHDSISNKYANGQWVINLKPLEYISSEFHFDTCVPSRCNVNRVGWKQSRLET